MATLARFFLPPSKVQEGGGSASSPKVRVSQIHSHLGSCLTWDFVLVVWQASRRASGILRPGSPSGTAASLSVRLVRVYLPFSTDETLGVSGDGTSVSRAPPLGVGFVQLALPVCYHANCFIIVSHRRCSCVISQCSISSSPMVPCYGV